MAAFTTAEHQTAMAELEAEKSMLSAQVREQERELRAIQSACSNLNNNGYRGSRAFQ